VGADGMLLDDQDAWNVGPSGKGGTGISGLHNVSRSTAHPGCIWLTLQFSNQLVMLDAATMGVRKVIRCPQLLTRDDGTLLRIGGPHCLVECPHTGDIWVALKGSVPCHPQTTGSSANSLAAAVHRVCCNPQAIKERMAEAAAQEAASGKGVKGLSAPSVELPEGFAIWRLDTSKYDPQNKAAYGGELFECEPSPPMVAIDMNADCWVVQDRAPFVMHVKRGDSQTEQLRVPLGNDCKLSMTGPAIATAPDGAVWATLLGADGGLVRFHKGNKRMYQLPATQLKWMHESRFIHMRFVTLPDTWFIYDGTRFDWAEGSNVLVLISSNLVDDEAMNAITVLSFNPYVGSGWVAPMMRKDIPLPTQDCCCHRVEIISDGPDDVRLSAVVSELSSSRVFQIKLANLEIFDLLEETVFTRTTSCGKDYTVYDYHTMGGANSKNAPRIIELYKEKFRTFEDYLKVFGTDERGRIALPSRADIVANRRFDDPKQQAAWDALVAHFRMHCSCAHEEPVQSC